MQQMLNGTGEHMSAAEPTNVITVNLGIKARHLAVLGTMIVGLFTSGTAAGWLFMPAKQTDLTRIEESLNGVRNDMQTMRTVTERLTVVLQDLQSAVGDMRPKPAPKSATR